MPSVLNRLKKLGPQMLNPGLFTKRQDPGGL